MRRHGLLCTLVLCALGCDSSSIAEPTMRDAKPFIVGPIVARDVPTSVSDDPPTIHVKETEDEECGVLFWIGSETEIGRATGAGTIEPADVEDLRPGLTVAVWPDGGTFDSCPGQAGADAVEILSL